MNMQSIKVSRSLVCILAFLAVACGKGVESDTVLTAQDQEQGPLLYPRYSGKPAFLGGAHVPGIAIPGFTQGIQWIEGEKDLSVLTREQSPGSGAWTEHESVYSAAFSITAATARGSDEFYVAGFNGRTGNTIVQQWEVSEEPGALYARLTKASPALLGTPASVASLQQGVNAPFRPPAQRNPRPLVRTELYRGPLYDGVSVIAADPEGRFVLLVTKGTETITLLPVEVSATPVVLYDVADQMLLGNVSDVYPLQHTTEGRLYVIHGGAPQRLRAHLLDPDNDGVFSGLSQTWTYVQYDLAGYRGPVWISDFKTFFLE